MRDKPGFEHLNEPLHVLVEAELPATIIDTQLIHAREILQELLKPVVSSMHLFQACLHTETPGICRLVCFPGVSGFRNC